MKQKKKVLNNLSNILLVLLLVAGLCIMGYPSFSNWWNESRASRAIASYDENIAALNAAEYQAKLDAAYEFNEELNRTNHSWYLEGDQKERYESILNFGDKGIMGRIEIPDLFVNLPVYHGTSDSVLQVGIGHLEGSSFPVGGEGTHSVLSGHRGLPSAKLFTGLDKLEVGDIFMIHIMNETYTYEIDQIRIVLPSETSDLEPVRGEDYCTLMTCTPYGINTHRLLVRGKRIPNYSAEAIRADAVQIDPNIVAPIAAIPMLLVLFAYYMMYKGRKKKRDPQEQTEKQKNRKKKKSKSGNKKKRGDANV